ncbi:FHA domain-containing protein [Streptomyces sp. J2-1]|uniref:FHA domain-containing protein n=1 Tax=Streptomyces corallincola TaxID=2851888 RepID=UPI001C383B78|nr:FHA domain-containing protein [Streptomyces corallincola]MBV2354339.1 FHA domain-containing protein [Streptomyces corallincola]
MQIRLTVVDPPGPSPQRGRAVSRDVLVTAPTGTDLAAVASALAAAVTGDGGGTGRDTGGAPVVLYAGPERLDPRRCLLGEPPLVDGAVLALGAPAAAEPHPELDDAPTQLHVVAGPDAGGVHLLHGGRITVGRSADADVPLDDPDVSRLHCAVTVAPDGTASLADLGSTNGTVLDGVRVGGHPVAFAPGALLRIGESALRVTPSGGPGARVRTVPDGEGCLRPAPGEDADAGGVAEGARVPGARTAADRGAHGPAGPTGHAYGTGHGYATGSGGGPGSGDHAERRPYTDPRTGRPFTVTAGGAGIPIPAGLPGGDTHAGRYGVGGAPGPDRDPGSAPDEGTGAARSEARRRGLGAWARRLAGGARGGGPEQPGADTGPVSGAVPETFPAEVSKSPETWPDMAALLLTALGPGPRLWERGAGHPEALTVRLGTADRGAPDGSGVLPAVPVTAALREAGALGLAGPRPRLSGAARAVLAQLTALHSPDLLEIVLISADRARPEAERVAEWAWLGWLPHVRPGRGQDCRLLLAFDREQVAARTAELLRRVEEHAAHGGRGPARAGTAAPADRAAGTTHPPGARSGTAPLRGTGEEPPYDRPAGAAAPQGADARRPSWAREADGPGGFPGPYTVVVVDGDPGGAALHESLARLAVAGPRAGIHVVCLADIPAATASSPVTRTYEAACAATPTFRHCGAVALLGGDVAGTLRLTRVAPTGPVGEGTPAVVDAVSAAWAERFARALAPLRPDGPAGDRHARAAVPLPRSARLLDELGLARATPASLMARWADAADDTGSLGGRARAVLGAGPRGPLTADLVADGPHLLVEGPAGSGRTELLRAVVASLAAAERPDRLSMVLIDGRDGVGTGAGRCEGLRTCTDIPHVTTHLIANDPVRMREFAQSLSAELKRRAELLGRGDFTQWHTGREVSGRIVAQRTPLNRPERTDRTDRTDRPERTDRPAPYEQPGNGDLDTPPSSTMRLRPGAAARQAEAGPPPGGTAPLPRLVVVVDDLDALVSPALGSPGRPAAGSVLRALEAVARDGARLGVHLVAASAPGGRTAETEPVRQAALRVTLDAPAAGPDEPAPGRGVLVSGDGVRTGFQGGRVTGRIPRTATLRPTVVPLEWQRTGDPPTRRPVRELGNGPTDLALLASAVERAAREVSAARVPSLL